MEKRVPTLHTRKPFIVEALRVAMRTDFRTSSMERLPM
jgi:hypothetical protein